MQARKHTGLLNKHSINTGDAVELIKFSGEKGCGDRPGCGEWGQCEG